MIKLKNFKNYNEFKDFIVNYLKQENILEDFEHNLKDYNLSIIENVLKQYGFDLSVRAENLELEIFVEMANRLVKSL